MSGGEEGDILDIRELRGANPQSWQSSTGKGIMPAMDRMSGDARTV